MDENLKKILSEFDKLKGQFVITDFGNVVHRLIAIGADETDYYYVTYDGRKKHWNTCVGRIIPLKGKIDDEHYNEFIRLAKLNHNDQETILGHNPDDHIPRMEGDDRPPVTYRELSAMHRRDMENIKSPNRFLTEVCWDLN